MNIDNEIISVDKKVESIYQNTDYTRAEAIELVKTAALVKLADCVQSDYNNKAYLRIGGHMATYEQ